MKSSLILTLVLFIKVSQEKCQLLEEHVSHLGTKTPYRIIANTNESEVSYPGCKAVKIFGLIRHGTRTPGQKDIQKIQKTLSELKSDILDDSSNTFHNYVTCGHGRDLLANWTFWMETESEKYLTSEGEVEMVLLAKRLQRRFPTLLSSKFENDTFLFRFTKTQRTEKSAFYFSLGLFGEDGKDEIWFPSPEHPDPVLRFYKLCGKWRKEVKKSPASLKERDKFIKRDEVHKLLTDVSERLGLNYTLSFETVRLMYISCSFETAWSSQRTSPWCLVFTEHDIKILEYADELKYYWRDGYGFDINYQQSCPLFKNILFFLLNKSGGHKAMFYFTHSGTVLKALSRLGLFKDSFKLTSDIEIKSREDRLWKVSYIDAFASNLIFVLFKCDGEEDKILVTHQEKQVQIPGCPAPPHLCSLSTIQNSLSSDLSCNFTEICSL